MAGERRAVYKAIVDFSDFLKSHAKARAAIEALRRETEDTTVSTDKQATATDRSSASFLQNAEQVQRVSTLEEELREAHLRANEAAQRQSATDAERAASMQAVVDKERQLEAAREESVRDLRSVSTETETVTRVEDDHAASLHTTSVATDESARSNVDYRAKLDEVVNSIESKTYAHTVEGQRLLAADRAQAEYNRVVAESKLVLDDSTRSTVDKDRAVARSEAALYKLTAAQRALGRATRDGGGDNDIFSRSLGGLGGSLFKTSLKAKGFGFALRAMIPALVVAAVKTLIGLLDSLAAGLIAMVPNIVQVTSLLAGLPGVIAAIGTAVGAAVLGFAGIGDAVKAIADADQARAEQARTTADAQRSAADAVANAEYSLAQAHDAVADAQQNLTDARRDALYALQDLRIEAERANLSERGAELNLREARRRLTELTSASGDEAPTDIELEQAQLSVRNAQLDVKDAKHQNERTQRELNEAEREGIENSDQVVAAQEQLASALHGVEQAQKGVADATRAQTETMNEQTASAEKLEEAFRALSPAARDFARYIFSLRPKLDALRKTAQEGLLPGAQEGLESLMRIFPIVRRAVGNMASLLGRFFSDLGRQLSSPEWARDWQRIFAGAQRAIATVLPAFGHIFDALRHLTIAAQPVVQWFAELTLQFSRWASRSAEAGRESGRLTAYLEDAMAMAEQFGRILSNLWGALGNIGSAAKETGQSIWDSMERITQAWETWTGSVEGQNALQDWFERSRPVFAAVVHFLGEFAKAWAAIARDANPGLVKFVDSLSHQLLPVFVELSRTFTNSFGPALVDALEQVGLLLASFGTGGGAITNFLRLITAVVGALNRLIASVPGLGEVVSKVVALAGTAGGLFLLAKAFGLLFSPLKKVVLGVFALGGQIARFIPMLTGGQGLMMALSSAGGGLAAFGTALAGLWGPVGIAILAIAAVAFAVYKNWDSIKRFAADVWADIGDEVMGAVNEVKEFLVDAWNTIRSTAIAAWEYVKDDIIAIWNALSDAIVAAWSVAGPALASMFDALRSLWDALSPFLAPAMKVLLASVFVGFVASLKALAITLRIVAEAFKILAAILRPFAGLVGPILAILLGFRVLAFLPGLLTGIAEGIAAIGVATKIAPLQDFALWLARIAARVRELGGLGGALGSLLGPLAGTAGLPLLPAAGMHNRVVDIPETSPVSLAQVGQQAPQQIDRTLQGNRPFSELQESLKDPEVFETTAAAFKLNEKALELVRDRGIKYSQALVLVQQKTGEVTEATLSAATQTSSWNGVIKQSTALSERQRQVFSEQIGTFFAHGGALTESERATIKASLATGDLTGAQQALKQAIGASIGDFAMYKAVFGENAAAAAVMGRQLTQLTDNFAGFEDVMGQSYRSFVAEGKAAFAQGMESGQEWLEQQKQILAEWKQAAQDNFNGVQDALDDLSTKQNVTGDQIVRAFDKQLDAMARYGDAYKAVTEQANSRAAKDLLEYVHSLGLEGIHLLEAWKDNPAKFREAAKQWAEGKKGAIELAGGVDNQLVKSLNGLNDTLDDLNRTVEILLDLDTGKADTAISNFQNRLERSGLSLRQKTAITQAEGGGRIHTGGDPERATGRANLRTPPAPDEVDIRAQKGEFIVRREEAKKPENTLLLRAMNAGKRIKAMWGQTAEHRYEYHEGGEVEEEKPTRRSSASAFVEGVLSVFHTGGEVGQPKSRRVEEGLELEEYHIGGTVRGDARKTRESTRETEQSVGDLVVHGELKKPKFEMPIPEVPNIPAGGSASQMAWGGFRNGQIPLSAMVLMHGKYFAPHFAAAWKAAERVFGHNIAPITSGYRSLAQQTAVYNHNTPLGLPAAAPGGSMHGWGLAADIGAAFGRDWIRAHGPRFKLYPGDSFNDPYHISWGISARDGMVLGRKKKKRSDEIPATLHPFEAVLNERAVKRLGPGVVNDLNRGKSLVTPTSVASEPPKQERTRERSRPMAALQSMFDTFAQGARQQRGDRRTSPAAQQQTRQFPNPNKLGRDREPEQHQKLWAQRGWVMNERSDRFRRADPAKVKEEQAAVQQLLTSFNETRREREVDWSSGLQDTAPQAAFFQNLSSGAQLVDSRARLQPSNPVPDDEERMAPDTKVRLNMMLDGKTVARSYDLHAREADILLPVR
jgi:hypothetical protein